MYEDFNEPNSPNTIFCWVGEGSDFKWDKVHLDNVAAGKLIAPSYGNIGRKLL